MMEKIRHFIEEAKKFSFCSRCDYYGSLNEDGLCFNCVERLKRG